MRAFTVRLKDHFGFIGKNGENPELDVFLPYNMTEMRRQNQRRPCLVICPGGGYSMCSQRESEPVALHFLSEGFNVFILRYSCAPHRFPVQLRELAAAFRLITDRAEEWNADESKIAVMGFSAGAHLAAHYSNAYDIPEVREAVPGSLRPKLTLLCYPVITADERFTHSGSIESLTGRFPLSEDEKGRFSCEKLVSPSSPPAFIWHTAADDAVPVLNSLFYAEALGRNGVSFELHVFPFGQHGLSTCDEETIDDMNEDIRRDSEWLSAAKKWLKRMMTEI